MKWLLLLPLLLLIGCAEKPIEIRYIIQEVPVVMEKIVEVPVEILVEVVREVPVLPRNFETLDELEGWLDEKVRIVKGGDCDDWALMLQESALQDGYLLNFEAITPGEYNKRFKQMRIPYNEMHAINLAVIGNETYYVEPQTQEVQFAYYLD